MIWQRAQWGGDKWPAGYMPFAHTATGTLNRSPIFVSGDDNVGIGRIPETKLDIRGGLRALAASFGNTLIMGRVGINTVNPQAPLEVSGVMRLTPMTFTGTPQEGMIYYDSTRKTFRCYVKVYDNPLKIDWQDCGGVVPPPERPVEIWKKRTDGSIYYEYPTGTIMLEISAE